VRGRCIAHGVRAGPRLDERIVAALALARHDQALDAVLDFRVDLARQRLARMLLAQDLEQAPHALGSVLEHAIDLCKEFGARHGAGLQLPDRVSEAVHGVC
jgi:hypothetical protein